MRANSLESVSKSQFEPVVLDRKKSEQDAQEELIQEENIFHEVKDQ